MLYLTGSCNSQGNVSAPLCDEIGLEPGIVPVALQLCRRLCFLVYVKYWVFMQYSVHRVNATVSGLPEEPFTTEEVCGDRGVVHEWAWVEDADSL